MSILDDDQTGDHFNNGNKEEILVAQENTPINNLKDGTISNNLDIHMNLDEDIENTTFIRVTGRNKRFRTTIKGIHVPGDNLNKKINNLYAVLANKEGFLECRPFFDKTNKEIWIIATFDCKEAAEAITKIQLFDNNDFKLTLLKDRGDQEI